MRSSGTRRDASVVVGQSTSDLSPVDGKVETGIMGRLRWLRGDTATKKHENGKIININEHFLCSELLRPIWGQKESVLVFNLYLKQSEEIKKMHIKWKLFRELRIWKTEYQLMSVFNYRMVHYHYLYNCEEFSDPNLQHAAAAATTGSLFDQNLDRFRPSPWALTQPTDRLLTGPRWNRADRAPPLILR